MAAPKKVAKKTVAKKKTTSAATTGTRVAKAPAKRSVARRAASKPAPRADFGAPIGGFFAKQPPELRPVLDALRTMVAEAAPDAQASLKWGMPFYSIGGGMMCALTAHKSHVNLVLSGPPSAFADPEGRLEGAGKTGRHLRLTSLADLPRATVRGWLRTAAQLARSK